MEEFEDKIVSVKNELNKFFDKLLEEYKKTPDGLPVAPRRKDIDQTIYVGDADPEGWCKWKPVPYFQNEKLLNLLDFYKIERNMDIIEYFTSYRFHEVDVKYGKYLIVLNDVEPEDDYKRVRRKIDSYMDKGGRVTHIQIGVEETFDYSVVVEVKAGEVKLINDDNGKMRKIAPSLEEFISGLEIIL